MAQKGAGGNPGAIARKGGDAGPGGHASGGRPGGSRSGGSKG